MAQLGTLLADRRFRGRNHETVRLETSLSNTATRCPRAVWRSHEGRDNRAPQDRGPRFDVDPIVDPGDRAGLNPSMHPRLQRAR